MESNKWRAVSAIQRGDLRMLKLMVNKKMIDPHEMWLNSHCEKSFLAYAVSSCHVRIVRYLIHDVGVDVHSHSKILLPYIKMRYQYRKVRYEIVTELLNSGLNTNGMDSFQLKMFLIVTSKLFIRLLCAGVVMTPDVFFPILRGPDADEILNELIDIGIITRDFITSLSSGDELSVRNNWREFATYINSPTTCDILYKLGMSFGSDYLIDHMNSYSPPLVSIWLLSLPNLPTERKLDLLDDQISNCDYHGDDERRINKYNQLILYIDAFLRGGHADVYEVIRSIVTLGNVDLMYDTGLVSYLSPRIDRFDLAAHAYNNGYETEMMEFIFAATGTVLDVNISSEFELFSDNSFNNRHKDAELIRIANGTHRFQLERRATAAALEQLSPLPIDVIRVCLEFILAC